VTIKYDNHQGLIVDMHRAFFPTFVILRIQRVLP